MTGNGGDLAGRVALLTGAAGTIGAETALALAEAGAAVMLADLPGTPLAEVAGALENKGYSAAFCEVDITSVDSVSALIDATVARFGGIDVLDNNAGATSLVAVDSDVVDLDPDVWEQAFAVNARGTFLVTKFTLPVMLAKGSGAIVNISSGTASAGDLRFTAYASSKGAVETFTRYVATQYGQRGVRCNAIAPGLVVGRTVDAVIPPPVLEIFRENTVVRRIGAARDIADAVVFLGSDRSSYISGQVIPVDGGFFAHLPTDAAVRQLMAQAPEA